MKRVIVLVLVILALGVTAMGVSASNCRGIGEFGGSPWSQC